MSRVFNEAAVIDLQAKALEEPGNPVYALFQYVTTYALPAKTIAGILGVSPQTLYFWADPTTEVRPTDEVAARLMRMLERLKSLEDQGSLEMEGSFKLRAKRLIELMEGYDTVDTAAA